jgi:hypothetical protein
MATSIPKGNELRERLVALGNRFSVACIVSGNADANDIATIHGALSVLSDNARMRRKLKTVVEMVEKMPVADTRELRTALVDVLAEPEVRP